jgi:Tol biopolymer transport system component
VDEAEQVEITSVDTIGFLPVWSPCGANLAYATMQDMVQPTVRVQVMEAASQQVKTAAGGLNSANLGWLPDGDLWVKEPGLVHLISHDVSETVAIAGTNRTWSPDGTRIAYVATGPDQVPTIQIADAYGRDTRSIAPGHGPVWSPDGRQLAFWGEVQPDPTCPTGRKLLAAKIQVADAASGSVMMLARSRDLLQSAQNDLNSDQAFMLGDIAWSPDGAFLAVTLKQHDSSPLLLVLSTDTGAIHARFGGLDTSHDVWSWIGLLPRQAWSPEGRYVAFWLAPASAWYDEAGKVGIMDIRTGQSVMLPCVGDAAWLPSGRWLAAPQRPSGILLVTPDLAEARWLDTPRAESIVWRPQP